MSQKVILKVFIFKKRLYYCSIKGKKAKQAIHQQNRNSKTEFFSSRANYFFIF